MSSVDIEALTEAVSKGHLEKLNGADIHIHNDSLLISASQNGKLEIVKYLLENNANVHTGNDLSLILACQNGYLEVVKCLVNYGADIHAKDILRSARQEGHTEIVKYLVERGTIEDSNDLSARPFEKR